MPRCDVLPSRLLKGNASLCEHSTPPGRAPQRRGPDIQRAPGDPVRSGVAPYARRTCRVPSRKRCASFEVIKPPGARDLRVGAEGGDRIPVQLACRSGRHPPVPKTHPDKRPHDPQVGFRHRPSPPPARMS